MTSEDTGNELLTIGDFARQTRLTTKALRIYDETGLLRPAEVDGTNGYRRYAAEQIQTARLIGLLRGIDLGLADIGLLLTELGSDCERAVQRLGRHLSELEARHSSRRLLARHINAILREADHPMFTIASRHVPAQRVMSMQRRLRAHETDAFVTEAKVAFARHLDRARPTGPFTLIFHGNTCVCTSPASRPSRCRRLPT